MSCTAIYAHMDENATILISLFEKKIDMAYRTDVPCPPMRIKRSTENPIEELIARGVSPSQLAAEWGFDSTSSITQLKSFTYVPPYEKAKLIAVTFGWKSAGEVIDYWAAKVDPRGATRKAANS